MNKQITYISTNDKMPRGKFKNTRAIFVALAAPTYIFWTEYNASWKYSNKVLLVAYRRMIERSFSFSKDAEIIIARYNLKEQYNEILRQNRRKERGY